MRKNKTRNPDCTTLAVPSEQTTMLASPKPKRTSPPAVVEIPAKCPHCHSFDSTNRGGTKTEENGSMMLPDGTIHVGVVRRYKTCGVCQKNFVTVSPM